MPLSNHMSSVHIIKHRIQWFGNPRAYSQFLDETLNADLRSITQTSHAATLEYRLLWKVQLRQVFGLSTHYYAFVRPQWSSTA